MKSMLFAAGLGTRLKPLTDTMPKALVPVCGRPLIDITLSSLVSAGVSEVVINVHHFGQQIIDYVQTHDWGISVKISDEREELLDTGGGLRHAMSLFSPGNSPILIHNVDILSNADLRGFYETHLNSGCDAALLVSERSTQRYLLFDDEMRLRAWTNIATGQVKTPFPDLQIGKLQRYAFSGIHCFSPRLAAFMKPFGTKFSIMDFYLSVCAMVDIRGYVQNGLQLLDVGKLDTLAAAEEWLAQK